MEPVFMYWDKVKFENNNNNFKDFTVKFSNGDSLDGVFFKKKQRLLYNKFVICYNSRKKCKRIERLRENKKNIRYF